VKDDDDDDDDDNNNNNNNPYVPRKTQLSKELQYHSFGATA
jgi:hypothetical protein